MKQFLKDMGKGLLASVFFGSMAAMIAGCAPSGNVSDEAVAKGVKYFQDKRTGLCFAYWKGEDGMTAVPCEKVTALIENGWSR